MDDRLANQIESFRTRLQCLDRPEHRDLWLDQPPVKFTERVTEARRLFARLVESASRQSAPLTGITADKRQRRRRLEAAMATVAPGYAVFCLDRRRDDRAVPFRLRPSRWRGLRDEALLQRADLLVGQIGALIAGPEAAEAAEYGLDAGGLEPLAAAAGAFGDHIVGPQGALADRAALTADLPHQSRAVKAAFGRLEDLLPQFAATPAGRDFVAAYAKSRQIIDRGRSRRRPAAPAATDSVDADGDAAVAVPDSAAASGDGGADAKA